MSPFDTEPMTSYSCSIVTMALSRVVSEIFNVKNIATLRSQSRAYDYSKYSKCHDLENRVKGPSRSLKISSFQHSTINGTE